MRSVRAKAELSMHRARRSKGRAEVMKKFGHKIWRTRIYMYIEKYIEILYIQVMIQQLVDRGLGPHGVGYVSVVRPKQPNCHS